MWSSGVARGAFLPAAFVALLATGCGPGVNPVERRKVENELKEIGLAYHNCVEATGKGPAKPDDLYPYVEGPPTPASQGLANGKYAVYWNATFAPAVMPEGTSVTVLGYYKDVPTAGGPVLMAEGFVKTMTAEEFKSAPKPVKQ
jgi:hypothetical protein